MRKNGIDLSLPVRFFFKNLGFVTGGESFGILPVVKRRLMLLVLDGWGINPRREANAIALARTPTWDGLLERYPHGSLVASGECVGLRPGLMGNSEVGHMTFGAGRVIIQDITRIDRSIDDGAFFDRPAIRGVVEHVRKTGGDLHLFGLASDGGVHSAGKHLFALLELAEREKVKLCFHAQMDGRDTPPTSGLGFVRRLASWMKEKGVGRFGSIMGRYWGMDRDKRWDRTSRAFHAMTLLEGRAGEDPVQAVEEAYERGETDEFIEPVVFPGGKIGDGDALFFFDFRADRMRQMAAAFAFPEFDDFERRVSPKIHLACMTSYREEWALPVAFPREPHFNTLGSVLAENRVRQLRIAETEKYAHVTYFFNGGSDTVYPEEERILVDSPRVATYDLQPEMSAPEITNRVVEAIGSDRFGAIIQNYANPDMLGHTGKLDATIRACEAVDSCLERVVRSARKHGWTILVTGDHGNCEQMVSEETGEPHTYHTTNPVPLVVAGEEWIGAKVREGGSFADVAPTFLSLAGIDVPKEMTGKTLLG
jgi:2,3-bisphosphoglycerate-independent phosphoglycerate mutase